MTRSNVSPVWLTGPDSVTCSTQIVLEPVLRVIAEWISHRISHTRAVSTEPAADPAASPPTEPEAAPRPPLLPAESTEPRPSRFGALLGLASAALKRTPGMTSSLDFTERELSRVETLVWRELRTRMSAATGTAAVGHPAAGYGADDDAPRQLLAQLLTTSIEESAQQARSRWFMQLLGQLHPDEARILAALSDGTQYPVICVATRGTLGMTGPVVLENASSVGRAAGVSLPDWVPAYVTHLQQLQLVSVGPESYALADGYEILLTEAVVRRAQIDAGSHSRIVRRSLRLSTLGNDLWESCSTPQRPLRSTHTHES